MMLVSLIGIIGGAPNLYGHPEPARSEITAPPVCENDKGEQVRFVNTNLGRPGIAAGVARRDENGVPVVLRSNFAAARPELQRFIDLHECGHHQTGDVDRPHPPRNSPAHLLNESISDCIAVLRLRDDDGFDRAAFNRAAAALRQDMARIGFPESSISSRIRNMKSCFSRPGTPDEFIADVLRERRSAQ